MVMAHELAACESRAALICGIGGQDGAYLARYLLDKGYRVYGTSRDVSTMSRRGLQRLGVADRVKLLSMVPNDFRSVLQTLAKADPVEVYYLAGQSSVSLSFEQPVEAIESIAVGILNLLEAIRFLGTKIRLFNAGSSECFGDTGDRPARIGMDFRPRSPYAVAKVTAHNLVSNYREAYSLHASTGVLFNHESPLRPERFVTQKIVRGACRIALGSEQELQLGNLDIFRDWGWAPDYVEAMWLMLQQESPGDDLIATGRTVSLEYFVDRAFSYFGLDWRKYTRSDPGLLRPSDIRLNAADVRATADRLGWRATHDVDAVITLMCEAAAADLQAEGRRDASA